MGRISLLDLRTRGAVKVVIWRYQFTFRWWDISRYERQGSSGEGKTRASLFPQETESEPNNGQDLSHLPCYTGTSNGYDLWPCLQLLYAWHYSFPITNYFLSKKCISPMKQNGLRIREIIIEFSSSREFFVQKLNFNGLLLTVPNCH